MVRFFGGKRAKENSKEKIIENNYKDLFSNSNLESENKTKFKRMILALINLRLKTQKHILPLNFKNQIINKNQNYSK